MERVSDRYSWVRLAVFAAGLLAVGLALIVLLGVYPSLALRVINPSVEQTLSIVGVQDPAPAVDSSHAVEGSAK